MKTLTSTHKHTHEDTHIDTQTHTYTLAPSHTHTQATREVNSLNRRAANLLEQQLKLEAAAEERWKVALPNEDRWLGCFLPAVEIDEWGTFKFLVCRLRGRAGKQRICVRGRNYCTQTQIMDDVSRKVRGFLSLFLPQGRVVQFENRPKVQVRKLSRILTTFKSAVWSSVRVRRTFKRLSNFTACICQI